MRLASKQKCYTLIFISLIILIAVIIDLCHEDSHDLDDGRTEVVEEYARRKGKESKGS